MYRGRAFPLDFYVVESMLPKVDSAIPRASPKCEHLAKFARGSMLFSIENCIHVMNSSFHEFPSKGMCSPSLLL
jgi:hypothetical protein